MPNVFTTLTPVPMNADVSAVTRVTVLPAKLRTADPTRYATPMRTVWMIRSLGHIGVCVETGTLVSTCRHDSTVNHLFCASPFFREHVTFDIFTRLCICEYPFFFVL